MWIHYSIGYSTLYGCLEQSFAVVFSTQVNSWQYLSMDCKVEQLEQRLERPTVRPMVRHVAQETIIQNMQIQRLDFDSGPSQ